MLSRRPGRSAAASANCVAIDLGASAIRVVEVEWGKGGDPFTGARVLKRGYAPLPPGIWNDLDANRETVAAAIQHALAAASISARSVVACMPRRLVTVRFLRLPHAAPEQMQSMVAFEAQPYILFPLDEVVLDHHVVMDNGARGMLTQDDLVTVLLAAARRSIIDSLLSIFDRAGLELRQLSVSALALAENIKDSIEPTALLDLEPGEMDVVVVANRQLLFSRASAVETHGLTAEAAQRRMAEEAYRSLAAYQNEFRSQPPVRFYYGGADQEFGTSVELERALTEALEISVQPLSSSVMRSADPDARTYLTAIGLALQTREDNIAGVNLVPRERALKRAEKSRDLQQKVGALVALAALAFGGLSLWSNHTRQLREQDQQLQANQKLDDLSDRLDRRQKEFDNLGGMMKEVSTGLDRAHPSVDVLMALSKALPSSAKIWITQFSFEQGKVLTIRGESRSPAAPIDFVLALQRSHGFTDVRLTYLGDAQESENTGGQSNGAAPETGATTTPTPLPGMKSAAGGAPANPQVPPSGPGAPPPRGAPNIIVAGPVGVAGGRPAPPPGSSVGNVPPIGSPPGNPAGAVSPVSPPPGGIQPSVAPAGGPAANPANSDNGKSGASRSVLTSYIITCRINGAAKTLLPAGMESTSAPANDSKKHPAGERGTMEARQQPEVSGGNDAKTE